METINVRNATRNLVNARSLVQYAIINLVFAVNIVTFNHVNAKGVLNVDKEFKTVFVKNVKNVVGRIVSANHSLRFHQSWIHQDSYMKVYLLTASQV